MTENNFHYAMQLAKELYEVSFTDETEFEEIGLIAYNLIGNKRMKLKMFIAKPDKHGLIELPCDALFVEAITHLTEDWSEVDGVHHGGDVNTAFIEHYIEARKHEQQPLYMSGKFIPYEQVGNKIYIRKHHGPVKVLYKAEVLNDDDELPFLNEKEALAVATYVAYIKTFKSAMRANNAQTMQIAQMLNQKWLIYCDQARSPEYLNQNDMQQIINIKNSWDRGLYGSYKPIK